MTYRNMNFVAVDVETANADLSSICQVGLAVVESGQITNVWTQLVDPDDFFDPVNTNVHGIDRTMVLGSPRFEDIYGKISRHMKEVVVSHTLFDRTAISRACEACGKPLRYGNWLDSAKVARRAWPERYAQRGYSLDNIAGDLGISFRHHDAGEDAKTAAEIVLRACAETGFDIDDWLRKVNRPARTGVRTRSREQSGYPRPAPREGNTKEISPGEVIVFTGTLSILRQQAAGLASVAGFRVENHVTTRTAILVVGDRDARRVGNNGKSSKHRKAEDLIRKGHQIRIIRESDFRRLVSES